MQDPIDSQPRQSGILLDAARRLHDGEHLNEHRWRAVFENSAVGIGLASPGGGIVAANAVFQAMLGYTEAELCTHSFLEITHENDRALNQQLANELLQGKRNSFELEKRYLHKNGKSVWVRNYVSFVPGSEGTPAFLLAMVVDITQRKRAEESLSRAQAEIVESECRLRLVTDTIPQLAWSTREDGEVEFCNKRWLDYTGLTEEKARGWGWTTVIHPEDLEGLKALWRKALKEKTPAEAEARMRRADGAYRWFLIRGVPLVDKDGRVVKWYGTNTDIEDRKQAERALADSQERWRAVFENSAIGVALTDMEGRFIATNSAYQKMLGYSEEELRGLSFLDVTHEDYRESNWDLVKQLQCGDRAQFQIEKQYRRKDGSPVWVRNNVSLVPGTETMPRFIMALSEDVTERKRFEEQVHRERDRLQVLLDLNNSLVSRLDIRNLFQAISSDLRRAMGCDYANLKLLDAKTGSLRVYLQDHPDSRGLIRADMVVPMEGSASGWALRTKQPVVVNDVDQARYDPDIFGNSEGERFFQILKGEEIRSACNLPLMRGERALGVLTLASRRTYAFAAEDVDFLTQIAGQIAIAVENAVTYGEVAEARDRLVVESEYLKEEIRTEHNFEEIIGESAALKRVLKHVETVAPTDSSVLILGETGTGKELIARAIHNLSSRRDQTFVKVNCAAIPLGLLESELFGHEKGAFTGAISQKIGRFELAHKGTLFLDEIGDIPLELQPKLLRVLQEKEFERLGSTRTVHVDVRLVAATSRDLVEMIEEQRFRTDLYYRLNVFPLKLPPLRERPQDIAVLARHFIDKFARRMNKSIQVIPDEVMEALTQHHWLGNIRELQNFIERAVILSPGTVLRAPLSELRHGVRDGRTVPVTLEEAEREHILKTLQDCNWALSGPSGAAARLGLKRTTLSYKMQKLGIKDPRK